MEKRCWGENDGVENETVPALKPVEGLLLARSLLGAQTRDGCEKKQRSHRNKYKECLVLLRLLVTTELSVASDLHSGNAHLHGLEHLVGLSIHKDLLLLKSRVFGDEIETALSLLLLKLQGDATHRTSLDSLHEVLFVIPWKFDSTVTYPAILFLILLEGRSAHSSTDYA